MYLFTFTGAIGLTMMFWADLMSWPWRGSWR
jgi:hypothetical protein